MRQRARLFFGVYVLRSRENADASFRVYLGFFYLSIFTKSCEKKVEKKKREKKKALRILYEFLSQTVAARRYKTNGIFWSSGKSSSECWVSSNSPKRSSTGIASWSSLSPLKFGSILFKKDK